MVKNSVHKWGETSPIEV